MILANCSIITEGQLLERKAIIIENGIIHRIIAFSKLPKNEQFIDLEGAYICPGFIDLQIMGAGGALFGGQPSQKALQTMENTLLKDGTVAFLPTVSTNKTSVITTAISVAVNYRKKALGNFLGLHIEGPYINPRCRGAHPEKYIKKATFSEVSHLLNIAHGEIKMITLAPELQEEAVMQHLASLELVVAMGHSHANYEETAIFLQNTVHAVTHLFNGMPAMHHRQPGPIPAIFEHKPYTSIVADGIHVSYPMLKMAKKLLGEFLYLITDAATPSTKGTYKHTLKGDRFVTIDTNGKEALSGSNLTMLKAIQNCVHYAGISLEEAVNMATLYPARLMGIDGHLGKIAVGYDASFVVFDRCFRINKVFYKGDLPKA